MMTDQPFKVYAIGTIRKEDGRVWIDIAPDYRDAMAGLEEFSHIVVCYWFDRNDTAVERRRLKVHPRGDRRNPLTGVFATHSPKRPNLIAISNCRILSIENTAILIDAIDAFDRTPVIDIKCYIPSRIDDSRVRMPPWAAALPGPKEKI